MQKDPFSQTIAQMYFALQDFCEDEWRKSRLEIDCTKGDGLHFIAPKGSGCNPFSATSEGINTLTLNHIILNFDKPEK